MATKKRTKGKAARKVGKPAKAASRKRSTTAAKKSRPRATAASTAAAPQRLEPGRAMDLLRAWSPSRYSSR